ncbi:hypothetical protein EAS56_07800 [Bradyrhizobium guangzhouense]|uniref:Uncharacterized protein n=1 Tax=Bradyrhizobium guangzhouense TaxID=1325095 RepID=A0AAE5X5P7_9BRAD|nr:hypothetical protein XH91_30230 [Bradyrhizobium guangzhouense]RXH15912.1 hypothetical protein EAS56_07800 [Bradyrhizobium guangzhouense]
MAGALARARHAVAGALVRPRCRLNASVMRNRILIFSSALVVFTVAVFLFEAKAGSPPLAPDHCGFWTTMDAGLSCR